MSKKTIMAVAQVWVALSNVLSFDSKDKENETVML